MKIDFNELVKQLYDVNNKQKNMILQNIMVYLKDHYSDDLLFGITDLAIYCLKQDKVIEAKKILDTINLNQDFNLNLLKKQCINYSKNNVFNLYKTYNHKYFADHIFKFIVRYKYNTLKLLGVLSFNRNGYIRYNALVELNKYDFAKTIPFYLYRVNDWVESISDYSTKMILDHLKEDYLDGVLSNIHLFKGLSRCERQKTKIDQVINEVNDYLLDSDTNKLIYAFKKEKEIKCKRKLLDTLIKKDDILVVNFLKKYHHHDNYINNTMNAYLVKRLIKNDFDNYLKNSLHPYQAYIYINTIHDIDKIVPYIYHQSVFVQRHARYILRSYGKTITIHDYLEELELKNYKRKYVVRGLIDICSGANKEILLQFLNDDTIYARKMAFNKLCSLRLISDMDAIALLKSNLSKYASDTLSKYHILVSLEDLNKLYLNGNENQKINIIKLIEGYPKWDALEGLLTLLNKEKKENTKELLNQMIINWYEKYKRERIPVDNNQKVRISQLINHSKNSKISHIYYQLL